MKSMIVYGSEYGTTKKYAEKLSELTGVEVCSYDKVQNLAAYDRIIYLGGLYAGGVKGLKHTIKLLRPNIALTIATVGLADVLNKENIDNIRKSIRNQIPNTMYNKAELFHLRGGIDYGKLNFKHKTLMSLLYKSVKKTPAEKRTAEVNALIETYNKGIDFMDFDTLKPIVEGMK